MESKTFNGRNLNKAGFTHTKEQDFSDDGTRFHVYEYKGIPVSYAKVGSDVYISIRLDYIGMSYGEYSTLNSYKLMNEFNGVTEGKMDVDKLVLNIETVKAEARL